MIQERKKESGQRLVWLDWMKTLAIFLIIAGHCWVPYNEYIYVFSVPCFFILSGFLTKHEDDNKLFWKKLIGNLLIPMVIIFFINNMLFSLSIEYIRGRFENNFIWQKPLLSLMGMQGHDFPAGGLAGLWFVYTLAICKIILQFISDKYSKFSLPILCILFLGVAYLLHLKNIVVYNSIVNVLLAMPFFYIGYLFRPLKEHLNSISKKIALSILIISVCGIWLCGRYNDIVMMYKCSFGSSMVLCFIGAMCGTSLLYVLSIFLQFIQSKIINTIVSTISGGTLIILGFHSTIIQFVTYFLPISNYLLYILSFFILIFFVPIIIFLKKYFPIIYGKYRA